MQLIDARDLAAFLLDLAEQRVPGAFNGTAPIGQTTIGEVLEAAGDAEPALDPGRRARQPPSVEPWTELPLWLPRARHLAGRHRARPGRRPALPPDRRDRRRRRRLAARGRRGRAPGLARRAPPAAMTAEREAELLALA